MSPQWGHCESTGFVGIEGAPAGSWGAVLGNLPETLSPPPFRLSGPLGLRTAARVGSASGPVTARRGSGGTLSPGAGAAGPHGPSSLTGHLVRRGARSRWGRTMGRAPGGSWWEKGWGPFRSPSPEPAGPPDSTVRSTTKAVPPLQWTTGEGPSPAGQWPSSARTGHSGYTCLPGPPCAPPPCPAISRARVPIPGTAPTLGHIPWARWASRARPWPLSPPHRPPRQQALRTRGPGGTPGLGTCTAGSVPSTPVCRAHTWPSASEPTTGPRPGLGLSPSQGGQGPVVCLLSSMAGPLGPDPRAQPPPHVRSKRGQASPTLTPHPAVSHRPPGGGLALTARCCSRLADGRGLGTRKLLRRLQPIPCSF